MRIRGCSALAGAAALLALSSGAARAQGITISPTLGVYTQANSFDQLRANANDMSIKRESALALGGNLELGFLRASLNYVSGSTLNCKSTCGLSGTGADVGKGKILMGAADVVLRPIPRLVVLQPYALAGIGFKHFNYDSSQNVSTQFQDLKHSTAAFHAGLGADVMFGGVGVLAEITDYMSKGLADPNGNSKLQHDAYGVVGLRLRLF